MMFSCGYFILTDGFWSYAGFVAVEVIFLSSIITMLMLIDAISAIKCKTVGKRKSNKAIKVATGADYESDESEINLRKEVALANRNTRGRTNIEFGDDEYDSEENSEFGLKKKRINSAYSQDSRLSM